MPTEKIVAATTLTTPEKLFASSAFVKVVVVTLDAKTAWNWTPPALWVVALAPLVSLAHATNRAELLITATSIVGQRQWPRDTLPPVIAVMPAVYARPIHSCFSHWCGSNAIGPLTDVSATIR